MRAIAVLVAIAWASQVAFAKPARDRDDFFDADFERLPPPKCKTNKSWTAAKKCLEKSFGPTTVLHDASTMKLASIKLTGRSDSRLEVFVKYEGQWVRTQQLTVTSGTTVVAIGTLETGAGKALRIDLGSEMRTASSITSGLSTRVVLKRVHTTVCPPQLYSCQTIMTSCELFARGRAHSMFHGKLEWDLAQGLRLRGDARVAGTMCMPPRHLLVETSP